MGVIHSLMPLLRSHLSSALLHPEIPQRRVGGRPKVVCYSHDWPSRDADLGLSKLNSNSKLLGIVRAFTHLYHVTTD